MEDRQQDEFDSGVTAEFAAVEQEEARHDRLPAVPGEELRGQLPGLEPERRVTDWGRSQRVEALADRTVYGFLFNYWFRVEVEGLENVPDRGGALLVANRAGALPSEGPMIAKAVRDQHPKGRTVHLAIDRSLRRIPGLGMLITKAGGVPAHPANLHRLLFDERELVLAFPEGNSGARKPLKERYRLRSFESEIVETARRARVPVVPIAVLGAEESVPTLGRLGPLRLPRLPLTPGVLLPAKFRIRFLEPTSEADSVSARDIQGLIQENLLEMVAARRSVWLG